MTTPTLHLPQLERRAGIDTTNRHALEPFVWIVTELDAGVWIHRFDCGMGTGVVSECFARDSSHDTVSACVEAAVDHLVRVHGWAAPW